MVPSLVADLCRTIERQSHSIVGAALFYCDFVNIHPFLEGNGRTALAIAQLLLATELSLPFVVPMSRFFYLSPLTRADALRDFPLDPSRWMLHFAHAVLDGLERLERIREAVKELAARDIEGLGFHALSRLAYSKAQSLDALEMFLLCHAGV